LGKPFLYGKIILAKRVRMCYNSLVKDKKRGETVQTEDRRKKIKNWIEIAVIALLCVATVVLDFVKIPYLKDSLQNAWLSKIVQQTIGSVAGILLLRRLGIKLFGKPQGWLYLIPCLIVAIDNFQFYAYFNRETLGGAMQFARTGVWDFVLFALYCFFIGLFEELIFRGVIFAVLAGIFSKDKKGLILTFVLSSVIFALSHLVNGFSIQVAYTLLTGGLFAFCLMKTRNIFCCAFVHGLYNFCGLLLGKASENGLGTGIVLDTGTCITMAIVGVLVGAFVVYKVLTYTEQERSTLYAQLGIPDKE